MSEMPTTTSPGYEIGVDADGVLREISIVENPPHGHLVQLPAGITVGDHPTAVSG